MGLQRFKIDIIKYSQVCFLLDLTCENIKILGTPIIIFFGKCFKKILNIFSNFFFYLKVQFFLFIMENNFLQMAASAGHAVAYTISLIFKYIIDCVQLYFTNGFTYVVL